MEKKNPFAPKPAGAVPAGAPAPDQGTPPAGQAGKLASALGQKHGGKSGPKPPPLIASPGTKGGRKPIEQESAAFLQSRGLRAVPINQSVPEAGLAVEPVGYVVTPEFVGEVSKSLLKGVEDFRVRQRFLRVKTLCGDAALAKEFADTSAAPPGCLDTISKSMIELARKYPGMLQWAPELTIVSCLGMWITKDLAVEHRLDELEEKMKRQLQQQTKTATTGGSPASPTASFDGPNHKP
jgi:hypothetical protein